MAAGYPALVGHHRHLLDDRVRTNAWIRAIRRVVRPGDTVAELGTGSGVLAMAARRAGARAVYALDLDPIVRVAAAVARANGIDGITFLEQPARDVRLPVPIDLLIAEPFGPFAIGGTMIRAFTELRDRVLAPGGRVLPRAVSLFVAPITAPALAAHIGAFTGRRYGLDWSVAHALAVNNVYNTVVAPPMLLARAAPLHTIDLARDAWTGDLDASVQLVASRSGRAHALAGWFTVDLGGGVPLSTGPGKPATIWRQVAFPLATPIAVRRGAPITIQIRCHGGEHFDWGGSLGDTAFSGSTRYSHPAALSVAPPSPRRARSAATPTRAAR